MRHRDATGRLRLGGVLPLKTTGEREARSLRLAHNLIRSLDFFWTGAQPFELTIVAPDDEAYTIAAQLPSTSRIAISVIPERRILVHAARYPGLHGWFRQMAIKIGYARISRHPWYLTLDADVICCRPFNTGTFWRDGRMITEWEPVSRHPHWWANSADLLRMPAPPPVDMLGVTPNLFSRDIALSCIDQLGRASSRPWDVHFAAGCCLQRRQVSEYALYTLAGMRTGQLLNLHHGCDTPADWPRVHARHHLWSRESCDFDVYNPLSWIDANANGNFIVVQSTTGHDPDAIMAKFEPLFRRPPPEMPQPSSPLRQSRWPFRRMTTPPQRRDNFP